CPTDEPVNRVGPLRLVERKLQHLAVELVAAVCDPVWPRDQKLAPPRAAELLLAVAVQYRSVTVRVRAEAAADLDYDDTLVAVHELDLFARGCADGAQERRPRHMMRAHQYTPATFATVLRR